MSSVFGAGILCSKKAKGRESVLFLLMNLLGTFVFLHTGLNLILL